jgi:prepilin-type N-terminal cleavage/methylation domain-containing protein
MTRTAITSISSRTPPRARGGFTLTEVLIALAIAGIIGAAVTSLVVSQFRFTDLQRSQRTARKVARSGFNVAQSDLRMVERRGIVDASATRLTVNVPFAVALFCSSAPAILPVSSTVAVIPADSVAFAEGRAAFSGFATRDAATGTYTYTNPLLQQPTITLVAGNAACDAAGIGSFPAGGLPGRVSVTLTPAAPAGAQPGDAVLLYHTVRYEFKASAAVPGTVGLWRREVATNVDEELVAPFAPSAGFQYFTGTTRAPGPAPADLTTIVGVSLNLNGASLRKVPGRAARDTANLTTAIYFANR